jgi:hypothetical protein
VVDPRTIEFSRMKYLKYNNIVIYKNSQLGWMQNFPLLHIHFVTPIIVTRLLTKTTVDINGRLTTLLAGYDSEELIV